MHYIYLRSQVDFLAAAGRVKRFHSVQTIQENTVAHHSWGVAVLCNILTEGNPGQALLLHALLHDVAELEVGDVPAPTKRAAPGLKEAMDDLEDKVLKDVKIVLPELTSEEKRIFKLADCMDGMINCVQEARLGNGYGVRQAFWNFARYVNELLPSTSGQDSLAWALTRIIHRMWEDVAV
jgi:5'-deoxynucleotidase YfbR-like HD superfamily hydrolase